ncbi:MAG: MlaD family protein [Bacteroidales bacterium]|nr:MlaD family protein [Bacteroidales bacterium]
MKIKKEVKIGAVAVIALVLFVWGYNFLKGSSIFSGEYRLYAHYPNSSGLSQSDPVILNGFRIGQVEKIKFDPSNDGSLVVSLIITSSFPIPDNSVAKIVNTSITGSKGVEIFLGNATTYLSHGDNIHSELDPSMVDRLAKEIMPLKEKIEDLVESLNITAQSINDILNDQSRKDMIESLANIRKITGMAANQQNNLDAIMTNAKSFTEDLKQSSEQFDHIVTNVSTITDDIAQADIAGTINQLQHTIASMDSILQQIQSDNNTLGMLMTTDSLHNELTRSTEQLRLLLEDVRKNPKKYVKFSVF